LWTITYIRRGAATGKTTYILRYDGPSKAITARNKEDLREDFEYMFPWEYIKNYPKSNVE
jgi:hypothetical protein